MSEISNNLKLKAMNITNNALKSEIKSILKDNSNIISVSKGCVNNQPTIEIIESDPKAYSSYLYGRECDRDVDLALLKTIINSTK